MLPHSFHGSFLFSYEWYFTVWMDHHLLTHSPTKGHSVVSTFWQNWISVGSLPIYLPTSIKTIIYENPGKAWCVSLTNAICCWNQNLDLSSRLFLLLYMGFWGFLGGRVGVGRGRWGRWRRWARTPDENIPHPTSSFPNHLLNLTQAYLALRLSGQHIFLCDGEKPHTGYRQDLKFLKGAGHTCLVQVMGSVV